MEKLIKNYLKLELKYLKRLLFLYRIRNFIFIDMESKINYSLFKEFIYILKDLSENKIISNEKYLADIVGHFFIQKETHYEGIMFLKNLRVNNNINLNSIVDIIVKDHYIDKKYIIKELNITDINVLKLKFN